VVIFVNVISVLGNSLYLREINDMSPALAEILISAFSQMVFSRFFKHLLNSAHLSLLTFSLSVFKGIEEFEKMKKYTLPTLNASCPSVKKRKKFTLFFIRICLCFYFAGV